VIRQSAWAMHDILSKRNGCLLLAVGMCLFALPLIAQAASSSTKRSKTGNSTTKRTGRPGRVQVGLDVLESEKFAALRGKHVGLITNHTGLDALGRSTIDQLSKAPGVQLAALFSPEHGLAGRNDEKVASSKDAATGLPVFSLYGET